MKYGVPRSVLAVFVQANTPEKRKMLEELKKKFAAKKQLKAKK